MRPGARLHTGRRRREDGGLLAIPVEGRPRRQAACFLTSLCLHWLAVSFLILVDVSSIRCPPDPSEEFRELAAPHSPRVTRLDLRPQKASRRIPPRVLRKAAIRHPSQAAPESNMAESMQSPAPGPPVDTLEEARRSTNAKQQRTLARFELATLSVPRPRLQAITPEPAPPVGVSRPPDLALSLLDSIPRLRFRALEVDRSAPPKQSLPTDLISPTVLNPQIGLTVKLDWGQPIEPLRYSPPPSQQTPPRTARIESAPAPRLEGVHSLVPALDTEVIQRLPRLRYFRPATTRPRPEDEVAVQTLVPFQEPPSLAPAAGNGVGGSSFAVTEESAGVLSLFQQGLLISGEALVAGEAAGTQGRLTPRKNATGNRAMSGGALVGNPAFGLGGETGTEVWGSGVGEAVGAAATTSSAVGGGPPGLPALSVAAAGALIIATRPAPRRNVADGLEYAWIPPGTFRMGCVPEDAECRDMEKPRHMVRLGRGFWMGRTEVTV